MSMITCTVEGCSRRPATIGVRDFLLTQSVGVQLNPPLRFTVVFCEDHAQLFDDGELTVEPPRNAALGTAHVPEDEALERRNIANILEQHGAEG
jgi:hypothetical protein